MSLPPYRPPAGLTAAVRRAVREGRYVSVAEYLTHLIERDVIDRKEQPEAERNLESRGVVGDVVLVFLPDGSPVEAERLATLVEVPWALSPAFHWRTRYVAAAVDGMVVAAWRVLDLRRGSKDSRWVPQLGEPLPYTEGTPSDKAVHRHVVGKTAPAQRNRVARLVGHRPAGNGTSR